VIPHVVSLIWVMDDQNTILIAAIALAVFGGFIAIVILVGSKWLAGSFGWSAVAESFPVTQEYAGDWRKKQSGYMNGFFLPDCINVGADDRFVYFAFGIPAQGFKPAQIPWSAITDVQRSGKSIAFKIDRVQVRIRQDSFNPVLLVKLLGTGDTTDGATE